MIAHAPTTESTPYLHPGKARIILARSKAREGVRLTLAVLLLTADANGIISGYTRELARTAGWEPLTLKKHLATLRMLGELDTLKSPGNRSPGMWRIVALS